MESYRHVIVHAGVRGMKWGVRNQDTLRKYGLLTWLDNNKRGGASTIDSLKKNKDDVKVNPAASESKLPEGFEEGEEYKSWNDIPEDPNVFGFIKMGKIKIYKGEDGEAFIIDGNGKYHHGVDPQVAYRNFHKSMYPEEYKNAKRYERFSQLPDNDPNGYDYVVIAGRNVYKAEDNTANAEDGKGRLHAGKTPMEAIRKAEAADRMDLIKEKIAKRKYGKKKA